MLSQYEKPRIVIKRAPQVADRLVKALCSGIEEEMIPYYPLGVYKDITQEVE